MNHLKETTSKAIGSNIRTLRRQRNWSQEDIAVRLGISVPAFSKIETGVTDVNLSRLEQIASTFGISVAYLMTLSEDAPDVNQHQLEAVQKRLVARESEIARLQRKVIELYEELYILPAMAV